MSFYLFLLRFLFFVFGLLHLVHCFLVDSFVRFSLTSHFHSLLRRNLTQNMHVCLGIDERFIIVVLLDAVQAETTETIRFSCYTLRHSGIERRLTFWPLYSLKNLWEITMTCSYPFKDHPLASNNSNNNRATTTKNAFKQTEFIGNEENNCRIIEMHFRLVYSFGNLIFCCFFFAFSFFYLLLFESKKCSWRAKWKDKGSNLLLAFHLRLKFIIFKYSENRTRQAEAMKRGLAQRWHEDCTSVCVWQLSDSMRFNACLNCIWLKAIDQPKHFQIV